MFPMRRNARVPAMHHHSEPHCFGFQSNTRISLVSSGNLHCEALCIMYKEYVGCHTVSSLQCSNRLSKSSGGDTALHLLEMFHFLFCFLSFFRDTYRMIVKQTLSPLCMYLCACTRSAWLDKTPLKYDSSDSVEQ